MHESGKFGEADIDRSAVPPDIAELRDGPLQIRIHRALRDTAEELRDVVDVVGIACAGKHLRGMGQIIAVSERIGCDVFLAQSAGAGGLVIPWKVIEDGCLKFRKTVHLFGQEAIRAAWRAALSRPGSPLVARMTSI